MKSRAKKRGRGFGIEIWRAREKQAVGWSGQYGVEWHGRNGGRLKPHLRVPAEITKFGRNPAGNCADWENVERGWWRVGAGMWVVAILLGVYMVSGGHCMAMDRKIDIGIATTIALLIYYIVTAVDR